MTNKNSAKFLWLVLNFVDMLQNFVDKVLIFWYSAKKILYASFILRKNTLRDN